MSSKGPVGQLVKLRGGCLPPRGRLTTGLQVGNLPHKSIFPTSQEICAGVVVLY
jgi:hypothetical protein